MKTSKVLKARKLGHILGTFLEKLNHGTDLLLTVTYVADLLSKSEWLSVISKIVKLYNSSAANCGRLSLFSAT